MTQIAAPIDQPLTDDPARDARWGWLVAALFFVGVLGAAAFIRVDAAVYANGQVEVVGNRQSVQHPEGGVVAALNVREGDSVERGQVLLTLGSPQVVAEERALASQVITLLAARARLSAERDGQPMARPAEFAALSGEDLAQADLAMSRQREELAARRAAITNERAVYSRQTAQLNQQIEGYRRQLVSNLEQQRLIGEELAGIRALAEKGYASQSTVRSLERNLAALEGSEGEYQAMVARAQEAIGQVQLQSVGLDRRQAQEVVETLQQVAGQLGEGLPRWQAARDRLQSTQLRSPATGKVVGLSVFTVGGVVGSGQLLMDIVPQSAALTVVAQISPDDADDLKIGQTTEVQFSGLRGQNLPKIEGTVVEFSADSFVEERTGARFFRVEVEVPPEEWGKLTAQDPTTELRPGLPAQIIIPLRKRTMLQFIVEPLRQQLWRSFREH